MSEKGQKKRKKERKNQERVREWQRERDGGGGRRENRKEIAQSSAKRSMVKKRYLYLRICWQTELEKEAKLLKTNLKNPID